MTDDAPLSPREELELGRLRDRRLNDKMNRFLADAIRPIRPRRRGRRKLVAGELTESKIRAAYNQVMEVRRGRPDGRPAGRPTRLEVADLLGTSVRTLQRAQTDLRIPGWPPRWRQ